MLAIVLVVFITHPDPRWLGAECLHDGEVGPVRPAQLLLCAVIGVIRELRLYGEDVGRARVRWSKLDVPIV